jgi:hypothetical protein
MLQSPATGLLWLVHPVVLAKLSATVKIRVLDA